jgi:hypothetical protein
MMDLLHFLIYLHGILLKVITTIDKKIHAQSQNHQVVLIKHRDNFIFYFTYATKCDQDVGVWTMLKWFLER